MRRPSGARTSRRRPHGRGAVRWIVAGLLVIVVGSLATQPPPAEASESAPVQDYSGCTDNNPDTPCEQGENCTGGGHNTECEEPAEGEEAPPDPCRDDDPETDCTTTENPAANCTGSGRSVNCVVPDGYGEFDDQDGDGTPDGGDDEDDDAETGPYSETNYVMGDDESCDDEDEVASTGRGGGKFESYRVYGDEFLAFGNGNDAREIAANDDICIPRGSVLITCRDENDHWVDDWGVVQVDADLPTWWFEAVYVESTTDEGNSCEMVTHEPSMSCAELVDLVTVNVTAGYSYTYRDAESYDSPGIIPDKCWGTYPTATYQISWHEGDEFSAWNDNLMGWLTDLTFGLGKGAVTAALWMVEFGFSFKITQYADVVGNIADNYQLHLIGPFNLINIVWFALVAWLAITALRGKMAMAGGELVMTLVLLTLATTMYNPLLADDGEGEGLDLGYFRDTATFMDLSSKAMLSAAQGEDPTDDDDILRVLQRLQGQVHRQFVELPHEYLNWGTVLPDACDDAAYQVMAANYDDDGWPARHMRRAGEECEEFAEYNDDANSTRMFGAVLTMIVSVIVALTLGITAFTVLVCKFLLAVLFATTPFVVLSAVLPGAGRRLFWSWGGSLLQLVLAVIGSGGLVALELIGVDAVVAKTEDQDLMARWFLVLMIVATVFFARRKMIALAQRWATSTTDNLTRLSPGSAHWSGGGQVGFDLDRLDRGAMQGLRTAGYGAAVGAYFGGAAAMGIGRYGLARREAYRRDRRNKRYGARNLAHNREAIQEWEQRPTAIYRRNKDGKLETSVEARLRIPSDRRELQGFRERVAFIRHGGRPGESEAVLPGNNPNRFLPTYDSRRDVLYPGSPILDASVLDDVGSPPGGGRPGPRSGGGAPSSPHPGRGKVRDMLDKYQRMRRMGPVKRPVGGGKRRRGGRRGRRTR
jgi:TrbL/VirB6 plasmid conjugal transfer protein